MAGNCSDVDARVGDGPWGIPRDGRREGEVEEI